MLDPSVALALRHSEKRIVITGAGGWIGLALLDLLTLALGPDALRERVSAFGSSARMLMLADGTTLPQAPLEDIGTLGRSPTFVFHTAFLTKDRVGAMSEADYIAANRAITSRVLAALDTIGTEGLFVASSGAAAKVEDGSAAGALHLYGSLKLEEERRFAEWAEQRQATAAIVRIFALLGPRINKPQAYAIASFILDALAGRPIEVRSPKPVVRAYSTLRELLSLVFAILIQGKGVTRVDSGGEPLELEHVAREVAGLVDGVTVRRAPFTSADADIYHGDRIKYEAFLSAFGIAPVPLVDGIRETMDWLRQMESHDAGPGNPGKA